MRHAWLIGAIALSLSAADNTFLIRNATVHPVSKPKLENASVLVVDGKIAEVGAKIAAKGKVKVIEGKGLHVYPGMIDAGTVVGLSEISSIRETQDTGEIGAFNPQLRPLIALNPESEHIPVTRANGITTVALLPASTGGRFGGGGAVIGGQISLAHLNGWTWEEMEVARSVAMQLNYPAISSVSFDPNTFQITRGNYQNSKRQRDERVQQLEQFIEEARRYQTAKKASAPGLKIDLKMESMLPVLEGKLPVVVFAARAREIREAIQFGDKMKIKLVLAGVARPGNTVEMIAKKQIPVVLGSPFTPSPEEDDPYDSTFALASELHKAGIKIAFASFGAQFARNLPYQAGQAIAFGLPPEAGLRAVTLNAAEIFGVAGQVGSIDPGKWADLMVTDGDPLEIKTQVKHLFIKGEAVDLESKHTRLYKKYMARP